MIFLDSDIISYHFFDKNGIKQRLRKKLIENETISTKELCFMMINYLSY